MSANESDVILSKLNELLTEFRVFKTSLMGDDKMEVPQGRIPRIESSLANHDQRIQRIERAGYIGVGLVLVISSLVTFGSRMLEIIQRSIEITRH